MRPHSPPGHSERGIALVVALLVLLVLSLLAVVIMTTVSVETKIAGHSTREAKALNIAEAGVAEALSQIRAGNVALGNNPRAVAQIFNVVPGSVPALGTDSTGLPTLQPAGAWLRYSTAGRSLNALTVQYKTNPSRTLIYKYNPSANPRIQTSTGFPIYVVTATGVDGADQRRVVAEFVKRPIFVNAKGAVVTNVPITLSGASVACGYNHSPATPAGTGAMGRTGVGGCAEDNSIQHWEVGTGDMTGVWGGQTIDIQGNSYQYGSPATLPAQTGFYTGPWDVFNMTQVEFFSWIGPAQWPEPANPTGLVYVDNDGIQGNQSASAAYPGGDGEGLLYVDGDMTINGNFTYRGMIYIEGDLQINGTCWILGGLVVRGKTTIKIANGNCTVLYSQDTIQQKITTAGSRFLNLSWREF